MVFIVSDHGTGGDGSVCADMSVAPGCHVPMIVLDPHVQPGTVDPNCYSHYSLLKTWDQIWCVPVMGHAADDDEDMYLNMHL